MGKLLDKFKQFFENASEEELEELWEKNKKYNEYGPAVTDYLDKVENEKIMDMEKYAIYCTPEQTKRAIELGAPIEQEYDELICKSFLVYPTAEEMFGWLEEQEEISDLHIFKPMIHWSFALYASNGGGKYDYPLFNSRKEATLAAIDAALEYLENNRK